MMIKHRVIRCPRCHKRILLIPDIKAMVKAIDNHAHSHGGLNCLDRCAIVNNLTQQALLFAVNDKPIKVYLLIESYNGSRKVHGVALTEDEAEAWMDAKLSDEPQGSFFYDSSEVIKGES